MKPLIVTIATVCLAFFAGCSHTPKAASLPPKAWDRVEPGMTASQLENLLGEPAISQFKAGYEVWTDQREWTLLIKYDTNGIVQEVFPAVYLGDRTMMTTDFQRIENWSKAQGLNR